MSILIISQILGILIFFGQIIIAGILLYLFFFRRPFNNFTNFFLKNGLTMAFFIALIATLGSLYYSQILRLTPCELCWWQRIFMYPQVVILGLALIKNDLKIVDYSLALLMPGTLISLYHNLFLLANPPALACESGVSCVAQTVNELGYINIPLMSLTAFTLAMIILALTKNYYQRNRPEPVS